MKSTRADVREADVREIEPLVVDTAGAARLIHRSPTLLRKWRSDCHVRIEQGLPPVGPRWLLMNGTTVVYRVKELERWLDQDAGVDCGRAAFRGNTPPAYEDGDEGAAE